MKQLKLIAAAIVMAGCSGQPTPSRPTAQNVIDKLTVQLTCGAETTSGQTIGLKITAPGNAVPDSAVAIIDGHKFQFGAGSAQTDIETTGLTVGQKIVTVKAWLSGGQVAEGRARFSIKSDIEPERLTYKVIKQLPHNSHYYTQGLEFDGGTLYEGTGIEGQSAIYKIDFERQTILTNTNLPNNYFGEGVTIMGEKLYQLTWRTCIGFIYNKQTLNKLGEFHYSTEGWGLTNDGKWLIMSDGTETIHFIDTATMQEHHRIEVCDTEGPVTELNELEFVNGLIYANIYCTDNIVAIDPATGKVLKIIDMRNLLDKSKLTQRVDVLNGIAYQPSTNRWFVTGKLWPAMFQVEFVKK
ncbi:MAG: glutaminyl-peptide cyclotransferase [Salinivirgaceae bacterium]|nr:glutaminyl-peptide cyclotransferase [Salinivirgaceae bacterium]